MSRVFRRMTEDPAHDDIAAAIRAITELVPGPSNLIGFQIASPSDTAK